MESFKPFLAYAKTDTNLELLHVRQLDETENDLDYNEELSTEPHSVIEGEDTWNTTLKAVCHLQLSNLVLLRYPPLPRKSIDKTSNVDKVVHYLENKRTHIYGCY
jgi:hypothetical protein